MMQKLKNKLDNSFKTLVTGWNQLWGTKTNASVRERFASNAAWSLIGSIFTRGLGLIASIAIARILGVADFGELGLIRNSVSTLGVITGYGFGLTSTKYIAEYQHTNPTKAGRIITLTLLVTFITSILGAFLLWFGAQWIVRNQILEIKHIQELSYAGMVLVASSLWAVLQSVLVGFQAFRTLTINNITYGLAYIILGIILTLTFGIAGSVLTLTICAIIGAVLAGKDILIICREKSIPLFNNFLMEDFVVLWKFSLPSYLSGIMVMPLTLWALAMVAATNNGTKEIGYFSAIDQFRTLVLFIPQAIGGIFLPMLTETVSLTAPDKFNKILLTGFVGNFTISAIFAIVIIIFRDFALIVYGDDFLGGKTALTILMFAAIFQSSSSVIGTAFASLERMWLGFLLNTCWALIFVSCILFLFPLNAAGLASSYLISYIFLLGLSIIWLYFFRKTSRRI